MAVVMIPTFNGNLYFARPEAQSPWTSNITEAQEFSEERAEEFITKSLTGEVQGAAVIVRQVLADSSPPWRK
jgi:hypothetical protein